MKSQLNSLVQLVPVAPESVADASASVAAAPVAKGSGPLSLLLDAVSSGCRTLPALVVRTGLSPDVVRTGLDHLVRSGRLEARAITAGCPAGGCGSCALASKSGGCRMGCGC